MSTKRYIAYSRCSTEEQGRKGHSHEYQIEGIRRSGAVTVAGLHEAGYYQDTVSGTRFDNRASGLDAAYLVCDRNRGQIDYVFVYRWDRLGRDVSDCFQCIKKFRAVGVEVNCPDEWIDFRDPSYPLILSVKFGMAQSESMRISDRTRDGIHQANMAGIWTGAAPAGYRKGLPTVVNGKERRICEIDESKADIIRTCFELYASGSTKAELFARYGKAIGVAKSQFVRMFSNPFYAGLILVKAHRSQPAQLIEGLHPALISRELFEQCQAVFDSAANPTKGKTWTTSAFTGVEFYLKGVVKDPVQWRNMTAYKSKGKSGRRFGYYASQKVKPGIIIPMDKAHNMVFEALKGFRIDSDVYSEMRNEINRQLSARIQAARKKGDEAKRGLEQIRQRIDRIQADYADSLISAEEYRTMHSRFEAQAIDYDRKLIEAEQSVQENDSTVEKVLDLLTGIDTVFAASAPEYKNRILRAIFPEGFALDVEAWKVRTPCVNEVVLEICSKSITSHCLSIENGPTVDSRPVEGGAGARYRTHLNLIKQLFAA